MNQIFLNQKLYDLIVFKYILDSAEEADAPEIVKILEYLGKEHMDMESFPTTIYDILILKSKQGLADSVWKLLMQKGYECNHIKSMNANSNENEPGIFSYILWGSLPVQSSSKKSELPDEIVCAIKSNMPEKLIPLMHVKYDFDAAVSFAVKNKYDNIALFLFEIGVLSVCRAKHFIDPCYYIKLLQFMRHANDMSISLLKQLLSILKGSFYYFGVCRFLVFMMPYKKLKYIESELEDVWDVTDFMNIPHAPEYYFRNLFDGEQYMLKGEPKDNIQMFLDDPKMFLPSKAILEFFRYNYLIHTIATKRNISNRDAFNVLLNIYNKDPEPHLEIMIKSLFNGNSILFDNPLYKKYKQSVDEKLNQLYHLPNVSFINFNNPKFYNKIPKPVPKRNAQNTPVAKFTKGQLLVITISIPVILWLLCIILI